jgi:hypothetical protein
MATVLALTLTACGGDDKGALTNAQIEEIVRQEMASNEQEAQGPTTAEVKAMITAAMNGEGDDGDNEPAPVGMNRAEVESMISASATRTAEDNEPAPGGMSRAEVEAMITASATRTAGDMDQMTEAEAEAIARNVIASIPPKTAPDEYTKYVVENAITRYETQGLEATLDHYNQSRNVDGQWYVFIIDEDGNIVSHYNPDRLGLDLNGWVGTDANGYNFGPDMLSATEEGKWVSYVYLNPESGTLTPTNWGQEELKNAWVVRHDGLLFGSGWYINSDEFTEAGVREAVRVFRQGGLEGTIAHFVRGESSVVGMQNTIAYYNTAPGVRGKFYAFIADRDGTLISHLDPTMIGKNLTDMFGPEGLDASREGNWVTAQNDDGSLKHRVWVIGDAGLTFGSGWFGDNPPQ